LIFTYLSILVSSTIFNFTLSKSIFNSHMICTIKQGIYEILLVSRFNFNDFITFTLYNFEVI